MILTTSLEYEQFNLRFAKYLNPFLQYLYTGTLISCFLFAMGNRPQGSKWKYLVSMVIFALLTCYMLFAAGYLAVQAIKGMADSAIYAQIIISVSATYGCYVLSSVIALDPWHLSTSCHFFSSEGGMVDVDLIKSLACFNICCSPLFISISSSK
jgi:chitin synthase